MVCHKISNRDNSLIINKSQAQAGPCFYYSDLRFGVGRCFWFTGILFVLHLFEIFELYIIHLFEIFVKLH